MGLQARVYAGVQNAQAQGGGEFESHALRQSGYAFRTAPWRAPTGRTRRWRAAGFESHALRQTGRAFRR